MKPLPPDYPPVPSLDFAKIVRLGFYPAALALTLLFIGHSATTRDTPVGQGYPIYLLAMIGVMLVLERKFPLRQEWGMTRRTFWHRDVPMMAINGAAIAGTVALVTWAAGYWVSAHGAPRLGWPWWVEAALAILVSDFIWYWVHRHSHEGRGRLGRWLWLTHVHHHLPEQVYVLMHAVAHPFNSIYVRLILMVPPIALGLSQEAIFAASVLTAFQGLVSHFNVDIRAGWLNRVFIGTELHRYHHSADPAEGKNYAAVISLWDQLFGTFEYKPDGPPAALGVADRARYPADDGWTALMLLPLLRRY
ncbi:MAG TPA: sterol desaturase family protein [Rhodocyclaceae bacterium]|nr:sterol desaturase family protein [Rhodocyclaceae bacterium]